MKRLSLVLGLAVLCPLGIARAQLRSPNEAGVALSHWHTIVRDVDAAKKFWMLYGGKPIKIDETDVMKFPGVFIFLTPGTPSGGTQGTIVNHIGFGVDDVPKALEKGKALGGRTSELRTSPLNGRPTADVFGPDDLMVEFTEENGVPPYPKLPPNTSIESNHIHFYAGTAKRQEMRDWYAKMFGAIPGVLGENLTGDLPGLKFLRWSANATTGSLPTKGRALDHVGFEVKNLEAFCKKLEANGIKFDQPYSKSRHKSFASAEFTDPWGTSIELTEGLSRY